MFDWTYLILAFAGGMVGAIFGALPNFIFCGFMAIAGAVIAISTGDNTFSTQVAWGPLFGPHISFAGGAAAAAYAASKGKLASGRDISTALIGLEAPDVILVGGLFGALGYLLQWLFNLVPNIGTAAWTNTIALAIVVNAMIARLVFGKSGLFGKVRQGDNRWIPSEVGAWLPWQSHPLLLILLAIAVGLPVAYITKLMPASVGLGFGIVAACLIFLQYGTKIPVSHHIALSAEVVTAITGDLVWGLAMAILAAFLGEIYAELFTAHADTHIDPPSAALATTGLIIPILTVTGVLKLTGIGVLGV
ncbi:MAG: hypothetical protein LWX83_10740, partial [Anaerolineae bacterium]|nr:hypothetical protein [Anaerolineae bacterium]